MIGFKNTNNKVAVIEPQPQTDLPCVEELIKMKGFQEAQKIMLEYFDQGNYPLLRAEKRDCFFIERLRKVKERYFDEI
ncbi:MAG: hypothetical protein LC112_07705 [Flavobacteriales bacterium]|nr:hypothetical protein [Flavobacteriales bacterium]